MSCHIRYIKLRILQESRRVIQEMENKIKQLSKDLTEANDEKAVSNPAIKCT